MSSPALTLAPPRPGLPLVDSRAGVGGWRGWRGQVLAQLFARGLGTVEAGANLPLPTPFRCPPLAESRRYGITHFGIMIPDLPAPHHFLACAAILGGSGMRVFDIDSAVYAEDGPRHTATLVHGTAAASARAFTRYSIPDDLTLRADGSLLRFGEDLEISGRFPEFRLHSQRPGFLVDLTLEATGDITWFARSAIYAHQSLLTRYRGTLTHAGKRTAVSGLCTYEYARGMSPYVLFNRCLPRELKLPWDFFTYQVINLDADTQLLLTHCRAAGCPALTAAYLREAGRQAGRIDGDVHFQVQSVQAERLATPDGRDAELPARFRWQVRDRSGNCLFDIHATVDTPMLFGIGTGHVGGFRWEGERNGESCQGRGYVEYVDQRDY
ncbi:MAG: hypothetical protein K0S48_3145 [Ramlibacter sp.]|jgi:hypothetical protein|nr:hypothetical protein [Ramlibacter sp.]